MKRLLTLIVAMAAIMAANAKCLVLTLTDGTEVYYQLGSGTNPKMKFNGNGEITVDADTYTFSGIKNFRISNEDAPAAIESVKTASSKFDGNTLYITTKERDIKVYTTDGKLVETEIVASDDVVAVSTTKLPKGVYVVKVGRQSLKFMKR